MKTPHEPQIILNARHIGITQSLKDYATGKVESIILDHPRIIHAHIILDHQKFLNTCEIVVEGAEHSRFCAHHAEQDMYAAIDLCTAKVARQLRKYKTRKLQHRHEDVRHRRKMKTLQPSRALFAATH